MWPYDECIPACAFSFFFVTRSWMLLAWVSPWDKIRNKNIICVVVSNVQAKSMSRCRSIFGARPQAGFIAQDKQKGRAHARVHVHTRRLELCMKIEGGLLQSWYDCVTREGNVLHKTRHAHLQNTHILTRCQHCHLGCCTLALKCNTTNYACLFSHSLNARKCLHATWIAG